MTIWLQSRQKFNTLALLEEATGQYSLVDRQSSPVSAPKVCDGIFAILNGKLMALYPQEGELVFRLGRESFVLNDHTRLEVSGPDNARVLRVLSSGNVVATHPYAITERRFVDDPTPMIDDEDFDFGLLSSNISMSRSRKNVMLGLE